MTKTTTLACNDSACWTNGMTPALPTIKAALYQMQTDLEKLDGEIERLMVKTKMTYTKLKIVCEALDELLGDQPMPPAGVFPELNRVED